VAEKVGELYYDVTLETGKMIDGQRAVDKELGKTTASLDKFQFKVTAVAAGIAILAAAMAAVKSAGMADEMRLLEARVNVAAGSIERGAEAMKALYGISQRTQTSIEANADVFTRLNQSILQMGGTQKDTLRLTELLGMAIKVSGANAGEAKTAMLQFGQALGSGKLAGDELRSLLETAPYLMRQLADGLGVPVGALKKLGEEGKLTADVIVAAMGKASSKIQADFATFPTTVGGAMDVVHDQVERANLAFDNMTGTSAKLAGMAQGLGTVIGKLADLFGEATTESDKLGRSKQVQNWAETTASILTYVVDAGDGVVRVFQHAGTAIGAMAAAATALASGELTQAKNIIKELDADLESLWAKQLAGATIRDRIAAGGLASVGGSSSPLKPPAGDGKPPKKTADEKFDDETYLAELRKRSASEIEIINQTEAEKLRIAKKTLDEKKISEATYSEAVMLIITAAEQDRQELMIKTQKDIDRERLEMEKKAADERKQLEENRLAARKDIAFADPVELIRIEEEQKLAVVAAAQALDLQNAQLYEDQKLAITRWAADERQKIRQAEIDKEHQINQMGLSAMADFAGTMYQMLEKAGKERTALGKAAFLASKAIAVAEIIMNTEIAAAKAVGQLGIYGIPMSTIIRAAGYASAGMVAGMAIGEVAGGRQYGGPVSSGSLYRINETGAPEMFTGSNGSQYMLPTKSGNVTPADQVGGSGVEWKIVVQNNMPGAAVTPSVDQQSRTVNIAVAEVANQINTNSGPVWAAMRGSTNVKGRL
jgi:tape measure domain-containing protein